MSDPHLAALAAIRQAEFDARDARTRENAPIAQRKAIPAQRSGMSQSERDALARAVVAAIDAKLAPVLARLAELEARSASADEIRDLAAAVRAIRPPAQTPQNVQTRRLHYAE